MKRLIVAAASALATLALIGSGTSTVAGHDWEAPQKQGTHTNVAGHDWEVPSKFQRGHDWE